MQHSVIFYPVGNGDTSQIILGNGKRILFDFRHLTKSENENTLEINLKKKLKQDLEKSSRSYFDVVAFTHSDKDHIENSTTFFELLHAKKYQGKDRIQIRELWVPAAMILETATNEEQSDEFVIWRQEARYRLKEGKGIRVFSKPNKLKDWFDENEIDIKTRELLITDAGKIVPGFTLESDGVEFFCHSPFVKHVDQNEEFRNEAALILHVKFSVNKVETNYLAVGDSECGVLEDIVTITKNHGNMERLKWDLFNIPHHCSYKALSIEKGETETAPSEKIKELLDSGNRNSYLVSSSNQILDNKEAYEQLQPPHIQAKKCYKSHLDKIRGTQLLVTMEYPNKLKPEPIEFMIGSNGISIKNEPVQTSSASITSRPAPRAGKNV